MNNQMLVMKYHPAKKEIQFRRFQNGQEAIIREDSRLMQYMNDKGKFILQDKGDSFFEDIAAAFDGLKEVNMQIVTTKLDYEDLEQMVEHYNSTHKACQMVISRFIELPDMEQTFSAVKHYGEQAIEILKDHKAKLIENKSSNINVAKSSESFASQISNEISNIQEKIRSLTDNNISLCFAGAYSTGKSALINAILGHRILPEAVASETAKMFKISSPEKGDPIRIDFLIQDEPSELEWNVSTSKFEFSFGPSENNIRTEIQKKIDEIKTQSSKPHEQVRAILADLNARDGISSSITVRFPVALDTDSLQFTIYDTPGTDSNYLEHQDILNKALAVQTHSILIFVAQPTKLEGEGNNALLSYLKKAEEKDSKTSIDISRSLFVLNYADTITADQRADLRFKEIKSKDDDDFTIQLSDKKIFFISARYAYAARAVQNGIATPEDIQFSQMGQMMFANEAMPTSMCFRQNRCAASEITTEKMLEESEKAFLTAKSSNDNEQMLIVSSGLLALENEIKRYGQKYASAVKAYAIIDSVDKALTKLSDKAISISEKNKKEISEIEETITELRNTIEQAIIDSRDRIDIPQNAALPEKTRQTLHLDSKYINSEIVDRAKRMMSELLKGWFFGHGEVKFNDADKGKIRHSINSILDRFTSEFKDARKQLLEKQRDEFMSDIKNAIRKNGKISQGAKQIFLDIPAPQIEEFDRMEDIGEIYDSHKKKDKILFLFPVDHLDKDAFIRDIEERLVRTTRMMHDEYASDYRNTLQALLNQIQALFQSHLEDYSLDMKALIEDRDAMVELGDKVQHAANTLDDCKRNLNDIIWREKDNA